MNEEPAIPAIPVPLSLSALLESLASHIDRIHNGMDGLLLRAVPVKSDGSRRVYGGFVYARLRDSRTDDAIDARVPTRLAEELDWNREAVFAGLMRFKAGRRRALKAEFRVDSVEYVGNTRIEGKSQLLERWREAVSRPKRDVRVALQTERPRLVVITGVGSVAVDDIRSQLKEAESDLDLDVVRVPMTQPGEVAKALRGVADAPVQCPLPISANTCGGGHPGIGG